MYIINIYIYIIYIYILHRRSYRNGREIFAQQKNVFLIIFRVESHIIITALKKIYIYVYTYIYIYIYIYMYTRKIVISKIYCFGKFMLIRNIMKYIHTCTYIYNTYIYTYINIYIYFMTLCILTLYIYVYFIYTL